MDLEHAAEMDNVESLIAFGHEVFNEETVTLETSDTQLDQLEDEVQRRLRHCPHEVDGSSDHDGDVRSEVDSSDGFRVL